MLTLSLGASVAEAGPSKVKLTKLESVYYKLYPNGTLSQGEAEVTIRLENPGKEEMIFTVIDRISEADFESFTPLYGSQEPTHTYLFFDRMICIWKDLLLPPSSDIELRYSVSTHKQPPFSANLSYYVNGKEVRPFEIEGDYYLMLSSGDLFEINLTIENLRGERYVEGDVLRPPLPYSIEMRLPKGNFLEPECSPEPSMIYALSDDWSVTWMGILEDELANFSLSARVRSTEEVGEIELEAVRIQIRLDSSSVAEKLEGMIKSYNSSLEELEEMRDSLLRLKMLLSGFSKGTAKASEQLVEAQKVLMNLSHSLRNASSSVQEARAPMRRVIGSLSKLESNLTSMMERLEEVQRIFEGLRQVNISLLNLSISIPIPTLNLSLRERLSEAISMVKSTKYNLQRADQAFEKMQISLLEAADLAYNSSQALDELKEALSSVGAVANTSIDFIEASIEEIESRISEIESDLKKLSRREKIAGFEEPFLGNVELRASSCSNTTLKAEIKELKGGLWEISSLLAEGGPLNASEVALQFLIQSSGVMRTPRRDEVRVQVLAGEEWIDVEPKLLGVSYDEELGALIYRPGKTFENGSNPLIDSLGNYFRVLIFSESKPEVICKLDQICGALFSSKVIAITKLDNPYIALNMNLSKGVVEELPPSKAKEVPEVRRRGYLPYIGSLALIIPIFVFLKVRADKRMIDQLYSALDELEREIMELRIKIREKRGSAHSI